MLAESKHRIFCKIFDFQRVLCRGVLLEHPPRSDRVKDEILGELTLSALSFFEVFFIWFPQK